MTAASRNQSLSALVREYLQSLADEDQTPDDKATALFSALDKAKNLRADARLSRDEAHARARLR
ncbi:MAG: hypothetical protein HYV18_01750 [Gammaproteobacteria bacterium]|nr:hypothetical protein [Gammaproteobacteria bacterium]